MCNEGVRLHKNVQQQQQKNVIIGPNVNGRRRRPVPFFPILFCFAVPRVCKNWQRFVVSRLCINPACANYTKLPNSQRVRVCVMLFANHRASCRPAYFVCRLCDDDARSPVDVMQIGTHDFNTHQFIGVVHPVPMMMWRIFPPAHSHSHCSTSTGRQRQKYAIQCKKIIIINANLSNIPATAGGSGRNVRMIILCMCELGLTSTLCLHTGNRWWWFGSIYGRK